MAFPFSAEGEAVVVIDTPCKAARVVNGVERWLLQSGAQNLRREGDRILFRGSAWSTSWNPLGGIGMGSIVFRNSREKVVMEYSVSSSRFTIWIMAPLVLPIAMAIVGAQSIVFCLFFLPILAAIIYLSSLPNGFEFRSGLQVAAIRGLADGAAAELAELQSRSRFMSKTI